MSAASAAGRFGRLLGIVTIFTLAGPVITTAVFALLVFFLGVPLIQLFLNFVDLALFNTWFSIAMFLLFFFALASCVLPALALGFLFGIAALYLGKNSLWSVIIVAGLVVIGVVALGFVMKPTESEPLLLPTVQGFRQGVSLSFFLWIPAAIAASCCWLLTRPLRRTP